MTKFPSFGYFFFILVHYCLPFVKSSRIIDTRQNVDPCVAIAGQIYVVPSKLLSCLTSVNTFSYLLSHLLFHNVTHHYHIALLHLTQPSETTCVCSFSLKPEFWCKSLQIVDVVSKSLNFHTSVNYQLSAPPPFTDVHVDIIAELARIRQFEYESDCELITPY